MEKRERGEGLAEGKVVSMEAVDGPAQQAEVRLLPAGPSLERCPNCGRADALVTVGEVVFCVACGYASDSAAGCT